MELERSAEQSVAVPESISSPDAVGIPHGTGRFRYGTAQPETEENPMNNIIWIVGAVVIVIFALGFFGIRL
jgi:hypothetical protein